MNSKAAEKLKTWLLGGDPAAKEEYLAFRARGGGKLAGGCRLLGRKLRGRPPQEKLLYSGGPESSLSRRESPEQLAARLAAYDVVTFDVFDTLLLRPLARPEDAFYLLGARPGYPDLRRLRIQAEEEARRRKELAAGSREVTLEEIWAVLAPETGLSQTEGMAAERKLESDLCRANPYFLPVVAALRRQGKTLAVLSDMYLEEETVAALLDRCGFGTFDACLVSGERGSSKSGGGLYRLAQKLLGPGRACAHVGDDPWADQRQAEAAGWAAFPYRNVHRAGAPYRAEDMSPIVGSLYRGLVNMRLHNGAELHSRAWEYGYVYGGLFAVGYCRFVERLRREMGRTGCCSSPGTGRCCCGSTKGCTPQRGSGRCTPAGPGWRQPKSRRTGSGGSTSGGSSPTRRGRGSPSGRYWRAWSSPLCCRGCAALWGRGSARN